MKMWLDDVRPAPVGWTLVRNYDEAVAYMEKAMDRGERIDVASLDHDLGGHPYNDCGVCRIKVSSYKEWHEIFIHGCEHSERTGTHVVRWMEANNFWPKHIVIHSYNEEGAKRMADIAAQHTQVIVQPYTGPEM